MVHQICYGFYWNINKWSKLGQKAYFLGSFQEFFVYTFLRSVSYAPRFAKWKILFRYISVISFFRIAFVVVKLKIFQVFHIDSPSMKWPLFSKGRGGRGGGGRGFEPLLLQILLDFAEIFNRGSLSVQETHCLKNSPKFWILAQIECTQSLQFWSILESNLLLENQKNCFKPKFMQKLHP